MLVVREPGAAKNDLMAAALLLAAIAILVTAWNQRRDRPPTGRRRRHMEEIGSIGPVGLPVGWPLAVAGLAVGLAAGTKVTALAMAAALSVAVLVLAPAGRRWAAAAWWFVPALLAGGFWYLRNLVVAGNPLPAVESLGPISLPHPERLQIGRPDFSIAHYATDTGVWRDYFAPGLHDAFGALWPLVVGGARRWRRCWRCCRGRDRVVRGGRRRRPLRLPRLPLHPAQRRRRRGRPGGLRDQHPLRLRRRARRPGPGAAAALLRRPAAASGGCWRRCWSSLLLTDRADAVLRDPDRALRPARLVVLAVLVPAALLLARGRGASRGIVAGGFAALALAVVAIGYPVQRHYLDERFRNEVAAESIPGMDLDSAYRWARGVEDARIGLAGTTAGFAQLRLLRHRPLQPRSSTSATRARTAPSTRSRPARAFRAAVNAADLDYLVTAPFLNFLHPERPDPLARGPLAARRGRRRPGPAQRPGHGLEGPRRARPRRLRPRNAPLREIPDTAER